jgi:hypothetical protein
MLIAVLAALDALCHPAREEEQGKLKELAGNDR